MDLVLKNESVAGKRRLYFYLVDATDGITPETGETGGQPQISVDGAAFADAGIGTLVHMGNGHYYAEVTQSTVNVNYAYIRGRYKSANTLEAPSLNSLGVVQWDPYALGDNVTTALNRLGSITGSGVNTVLGFFQALMKKDASNPSDIGGTYDKATDSQEAARERLDLAMGTGFVTGTHSLVEITADIAAIGSGGGGGTRDAGDAGVLAAGMFLNRMVSRIRDYVDEPAVNAKYVDATILAMLREQWARIWIDLSLNADNPIVVRHDVTVVANQQVYALPPIIGEILELSKIETTTGLPEWSMMPRSFYNPYGPGFTIEGHTLRFTPVWTEGETLRLEFIPSGETYPHEGLCDLTVPSNGLPYIQFTDPPTGGTLDDRPNAYAGYLCRIFGTTAGGSGSYAQEAIIGSYDILTRKATLTAPLMANTDDGQEDLTYEVLPVHSPLMEELLCLAVSRNIIANEGDTKGYQLKTQLYREALRAARTKLANVQSIRAGRFKGDERSNPRYR